MKTALIRGALLLLLAALAASCESPDAPVPTDGRVVLRFESGAPSAAPVNARTVAPPFDSVAVSVFRAGTPLRREVSKGAAIVGGEPVDVSLSCAAENGKKVSVELFVNGVPVYHGSDSDVDVAPNRSTPVVIDASAFFITALSLAPAVVPDGAAFTLRWPPAPAATWYRLEESATVDFATIGWSQSVLDTTVDVHLGPGSHYFRVAPRTQFAAGAATEPRFGYVTGGSQTVSITAVGAPAVIPGETISITGENFDFPGTTASIGTHPLDIVSSAWGTIVARVPLDATTATVRVASTLGSDTSNDAVVVQRVAYVAATGEFAAATIALLATYAGDFGQSGVVEIPVAQLDWRDMSVFDIVIVASDTGDDPLQWGGKAARFSAISTSTASVLAVGSGGATFLQLALGAATGATTGETVQTSYYTTSPTATLFTTPHSVTGGVLPQWIDFCKTPERTVALSFASGKPAGATLYAETGILSDRWVLADFRAAKRYLFWGYAGDPTDLTTDGQDCLANAMNLLYKDRAVIPAN